MLRNSPTNSIAHERAGDETAFTVHYLFFAWVHKSALFLVVVFGTASFATIRNATPVLPIFITLVGTIDLVFE